MKFAEWCDLFIIGERSIDDQHKKLLDIANHFHQIIATNTDKDMLFETLNELIKYAQKHFNHEEEFAKKIGYPTEELDKHSKVHEKLILDIFDLNKRLSTDYVHSIHDIEAFLTEWLILHILVEDKKIGAFLRQH